MAALLFPLLLQLGLALARVRDAWHCAPTATGHRKPFRAKPHPGRVADVPVEARGFEFIEHTADLAIRGWGRTLGDAFAEAARGLFTHMVELDRAEGRDVTPVRVEAETPERLLFEFLDDLLFTHQTELVVYSAFDVRVTPPADEGAPWRLEGDVRAEPLDAERHGHVHEVKAITFHDIRVTPGPPAEAYVIVDI